MDYCLLIPCSLQKLSNYLDMKSPPLSDLRHFIFKSISFSTSALKYLNLLKATNFYFMRIIHVALVNSSTNNMKYFSPLGLCFLVGPHTSACTNSNGFLVVNSLDLKCTLGFFQNWHELHIMLSSSANLGNSLTPPIFLILLRLKK